MQVLIFQVINLGLTLLPNTGYLIHIKLKGQFDSCTIHISRAQKPQLTSGYCTGQHWSTAIHWFIKYLSANSMPGPGKAV